MTIRQICVTVASVVFLTTIALSSCVLDDPQFKHDTIDNLQDH